MSTPIEFPSASPKLPPLLIIARTRLSSTSVRLIQGAYRWLVEEGGVLVFDEPLHVFQCVDGRWEPILAAEG